ncbi:hypothetical protein LCGC14_1301840 [marine sediment metagenome]|uniref:Uncharacterized protein n=1 Tax=marine sediment metagenome TaxID=412755 RepID=A0A0F9KPR1_9ZZZZ
MTFKDKETKKKYHREYMRQYSKKVKWKEYSKQWELKNKEKRTKRKKQYYLDNKDKIYEYQKQWKLKNKCKQREYYKQYRLNNLEKERAKDRKYKLNNKDKLREREKQYYNNNLNRRLRCKLSTRIYHAIRGLNKSQSTMNLVGCSIEYLKDYLESQFDDEMSWSNYGAWHIDHILPCCSFDLSQPEEQKKCFHHSNLQPLWAIDNFIKGGKYPISIEESD